MTFDPWPLCAANGSMTSVRWIDEERIAAGKARYGGAPCIQIVHRNWCWPARNRVVTEGRTVRNVIARPASKERPDPREVR